MITQAEFRETQDALAKSTAELAVARQQIETLQNAIDRIKDDIDDLWRNDDDRDSKLREIRRKCVAALSATDTNGEDGKSAADKAAADSYERWATDNKFG